MADKRTKETINLNDTNEYCAHCGRLGGGNGSEALRRCTGCWNIRYCSRDCQKRDWPNHRAKCEPAPEALATAGDKSRDKNSPTAENKNRKKSRGRKKGPLSATKGEDGDGMRVASGVPGASGDVARSSGTDGASVCRICKSRCSIRVNCDRCQDVTYCSRDCRRADWLTHRVTCKPVTAAATEKLEKTEHTGETTETQHGDKKLNSPVEDLHSNSSPEDCKAEGPGENESTTSRPELADEAEDVDQKTCQQCKIKKKDVKRCGRCLEVAYCSRDCQSADWSRHRVTCKAIEVLTTDGYRETERREEAARRKRDQEKRQAAATNNPFLASLFRHSGVLASGPQQQHLMWLEAKARAARLFPLHKIVDDFRALESDFMGLLSPWVDQEMAVVAVGRLTTPYFHMFRPARSLEDINGMSLYVIFYTEDSPWPFFQYSQFKEGNFICIQGAYLHLFADGSVGFRIDDVTDVRIIESLHF